MDHKSQGWLRVQISSLASFFGVSTKTIQQRAAKALKLGLLQNYETRFGILYAKYTSIIRVKEQYGPVHASAMLDVTVLAEQFSLLLASYKVAMFAQQETCIKAIEHSGASSKNIFCPTDLSRSQIAKAADYVSKDNKRVFLPRRIRAAGASQITVAAKLGVSRLTVNKYCKYIPHVRVWSRRKLRENPPDFYYCDYKIGRDGRKYRRQYREQPCYYLQDDYVQREKSAQVQIPTIEQLQDAKQASFDFLARVKKKACRSLKDYLSEIKRNLLEQLADEMLTHFMGRSNLTMIQSLDRPDLEEAITNAAKSLDEEGQDLVLLMAKRARKGKSPFPPAERLSKVYSSELNRIQSKKVVITQENIS